MEDRRPPEGVPSEFPLFQEQRAQYAERIVHRPGDQFSLVNKRFGIDTDFALQPAPSAHGPGCAPGVQIVPKKGAQGAGQEPGMALGALPRWWL